MIYLQTLKISKQMSCEKTACWVALSKIVLAFGLVVSRIKANIYMVQHLLFDFTAEFDKIRSTRPTLLLYDHNIG